MKKPLIKLPISNFISIVSFLIIVSSCIDSQNSLQGKKDKANLHKTAKKHFEFGIKLKQKNPRKAIEEFRNAILVDQLHVQAHLEYISLMKNQGRLNQVTDEYHEKIKKKPETEIYHYLMGKILEKIKDQIAEYQKAIEINPNYYQAHLSLGNCYQTEGDIKNAIHHFKEVVRINPNHEETHRSLGKIIYGEQAKINEAIYHLKEVIRINPKAV